MNNVLFELWCDLKTTRAMIFVSFGVNQFTLDACASVVNKHLTLL